MAEQRRALKVWGALVMRKPRMTSAEVALFVAVFGVIVVAGLAPMDLAWSFPAADGAGFWPVACLALALLAIPGRVRRFPWHSFANVTAFERPRAMTRPWVIDGDTIEDRAASVRYRLANIDCPETGDNAKCATERRRGEMATAVAIRLISSAKAVAVRRTFRTDLYGRRVAFVLVDGVDLGVMLMKRGLARPWRGSREKWCGKSGGLAKIAQSGALRFDCAHCAHWR